MSAKRATIYEVAALAGVSHQTVSRYLRHNGGLKPGTASRVEKAIEELNYRPNLIARSMRTRRTGRIAILLPAATISLPLRVMAAAAGAAHAAGYALDMLGLEGSGEERVARAAEMAESGQFEGILALASLGASPRSNLDVPLVVVSDYDEELRGLGALADGAACGEVVRTLAALGHEHLLYLAGPDDYPSARNRRNAFTETVGDLGLQGTVMDGGWRGDSGYQAIMSLPADTPITAVVAANDYVATGAIQAALRRGWRVPDDLSVFGWDDKELCRYTTPSLSTVAVDRERQGREGMERLIALIRHEEPPAPDPTSLHTVIVRESVGPARAHRLAPGPEDAGRLTPA
ncbi:MAG TPA: LacI family DNA-binding transcriptional regulator [Propionibacteriaceae bacterium]|nr:LacI family DNA-binding transcriptional regulator [Propionibacteriaceae bacterium]